MEKRFNGNLSTDLDRLLAPEHIAHAYGIAGERKEMLETVLAAIEKALDVSVKGNPDAHVLTFASFGIEDAGRLRERAAARALGGDRKLFIMSFDTATREAQNAVLKLLEEPTAKTHFFLLVPAHDVLLPTLRSRLMLVSLKRERSAGEQVRAFISGTRAERLAFVKDIIDAKDRERTRDFLVELEFHLHEARSSREWTMEERQALASIVEAQRYLSGRSPSVKMLLEHVALVTPKR